MTGEIQLLNNIIDIDAIPVSLANGSITYIIKKGLVKLNQKSILDEVLYVLTLDCNLIFMAQLFDEICYMIIFTERLCVIWDLTTMNLIGVSDPRRGFFVHKDGPKASAQVNKVTS